MSWRVGRKVGRTIYIQRGAEPSDDDPLIGVMDTPDLAREAVDAFNWVSSLRDAPDVDVTQISFQRRRLRP